VKYTELSANQNYIGRHILLPETQRYDRAYQPKFENMAIPLEEVFLLVCFCLSKNKATLSMHACFCLSKNSRSAAEHAKTCKEKCGWHPAANLFCVLDNIDVDYIH
jgi:hypothetical protein